MCFSRLITCFFLESATIIFSVPRISDAVGAVFFFFVILSNVTISVNLEFNFSLTYL